MDSSNLLGARSRGNPRQELRSVIILGAGTMGKQISVQCAAHGYIFNSMFGAMQRQALDLVIGGVASIEDVDRAWMGIFKMPIGPFGMMDQIGLDTIQRIAAHWAKVLNDPEGEKRAAFLEELASQGFCGTKTNRGFYTYPEPAYAQDDFLQRGVGRQRIGPDYSICRCRPRGFRRLFG